ncbi:MAG: ATP-binding protein [Methanothrix sp.]
MKRIIFTGKGGVGKTTILSTVARLLAREGHRVLVVDCDPSMNLAMSLGIPIAQVIALADDGSHLQERLGATLDDRPKMSNGEIDLAIKEYIIPAADGVNLIVMGTVPHGGSGCLCSPISLVKFLINYLTSNSEEFDFIMVDSQAGVEILGRGLSSEFDLSLVITEPTPKSIEVARHSMKLSRDLGVKKQMVIVNMAEDESECRSIADALDLNGDLIDAVRYDPRVVEADKKGVHLLDLANSCNSSETALQDILRIKSQVVEA